MEEREGGKEAREGYARKNSHLLVEGPGEGSHECSSCHTWQDPSKHPSDTSSLAYIEESLHKSRIGRLQLDTSLDHIGRLGNDGC